MNWKRPMTWIVLGEIAAVLIVGWLVVRKLVGPDSSSGPAAQPKPDDPAPRNVPLGALTSPSILVEKSSHRLTVLDAGRPVKTYRCAVGGGRGDKTREGDRCTPEGRFYVCVKNPHSKYVLSLGLSYPNEEDAARGLRDGLIGRAEHDRIVRSVQRRGVPPWKTALGGEIMIHGNGAGRDWTLGCVAMEDADIRELYPAIPVGTEVEIRP
jgi:lipoprotein-anchoring transpeptidase ErfK/SrfK